MMCAPLRAPRLMIALVSAWGCTAFAPCAHAVQPGSWELGMDVGARFVSRDVRNPEWPFLSPEFLKGKETVVEIPRTTLRAAYFVTESFAIEPTLGFSTLLEDLHHEQLAWETRVGLGANFAFPPQATFSPFLGAGVSMGISGQPYAYETTEFGLPVTLGVRIRAGDAGLIRIQSALIPTFTSLDKMYTPVDVQIGWSWVIGPRSGGSPR